MRDDKEVIEKSIKNKGIPYCETTVFNYKLCLYNLLKTCVFETTHKKNNAHYLTVTTYYPPIGIVKQKRADKQTE